MMYQFPEQTPYMMPYGMDYPLHGAEISPEMYPSSLHHLAMAGGGQQPGHPGHPGLESLSAESHLHSAQVSSDGSNNTQVLAALGGLGGLGHKIKREDSWMAKSKCKLIQLLDFPDRGGTGWGAQTSHILPFFSPLYGPGKFPECGGGGSGCSRGRH